MNRHLAGDVVTPPAQRPAVIGEKTVYQSKINSALLGNVAILSIPPKVLGPKGSWTCHPLETQVSLLAIVCKINTAVEYTR